jgi:serine/threonine protein kinase
LSQEEGSRRPRLYLEKVSRANRVVVSIFHFGIHIITHILLGAYGIVFKAMDLLQGNKMVALKKIKAEGDIGGISSSALREITLLMQLDHTNVVKLENVLIERERCRGNKKHLHPVSIT